jgi:hypothetical protein
MKVALVALWSKMTAQKSSFLIIDLGLLSTNNVARRSGQAGGRVTPVQAKDRRTDQRWRIEFPVTLLTRAVGRRRETHDAELADIGPRGARVRTSKPIQPGTELVLDVHCRLPCGDLTTLRFKGTAIRVSDTPPFEVAVHFHGRGRFLRDSLKEWLKKAELMDRLKQK